MTHEQLWAPWRLSYIVTTKDHKPERCFLCRFAEEPEADRENLVLFRGPRTLTVLNRYPYNNGHLLVAPLAHKANLEDLDDEELLEGMQALQKMTGRMASLMAADGFNVGLNLGRVAGAGLPGHLHWHLVPRWNGDTNFMPVLGNVNVIPQSLEALYELLTGASDRAPRPADNMT
ncbi:MAG TPA: HIT domain-containing protein [Planctomycetaceae bacterium]|nr:HIT domain-containing protein [Planctomycetaceae bacterium]